jgi:predicted HicB family RNase H-like nuclease
MHVSGDDGSMFDETVISVDEVREEMEGRFNNIANGMNSIHNSVQELKKEQMKQQHEFMQQMQQQQQAMIQ